MKKVKHVCPRCGFLSVFAARQVEVVKCALCGEIQDVGQPLGNPREASRAVEEGVRNK